MNESPNKGVQRTLHKVSGPLTPDVGRNYIYMKRSLFILIMCITPLGCIHEKQSSTMSPDTTLDQRDRISKCPVHNMVLIDELVDAVRMEIEPEAEFEAARMKRFPHTGNPLVGINNPEIEKVLINFCPECRKENQRYMEEIDQRTKISQQGVAPYGAQGAAGER